MADIKLRAHDGDDRIEPGTIVTLNIPQGKESDDDFLDKAYNDYLDARYGPKDPTKNLKYGIGKPPVNLPDIQTADPTEDVGKQGLKGPVQSSIKPHEGNFIEDDLNPIEGFRKVSKGFSRSMEATKPSEVVGGVSDVARGVGQMAAPFAPGALVTSPLRAGLTMAGSMAAGMGTEKLLNTLNVEPGYSQAAGDLAGIAAPGILTSPKLASIGKYVASQVPENLNKYNSIPGLIGAGLAELIPGGNAYVKGLLGGAAGAASHALKSIPTAISKSANIPFINPEYNLRRDPINAEFVPPKAGPLPETPWSRTDLVHQPPETGWTRESPDISRPGVNLTSPIPVNSGKQPLQLPSPPPTRDPYIMGRPDLVWGNGEAHPVGYSQPINPGKYQLPPAANPNRSGPPIPLAPGPRVEGGRFAPKGMKKVRDDFYNPANAPQTESALPKANLKETSEVKPVKSTQTETKKVKSPKEIIEEVNAKNKKSKADSDENSKATGSKSKDENEETKITRPKKWVLKKRD